MNLTRASEEKCVIGGAKNTEMNTQLLVDFQQVALQNGKQIS